MIKNINQSTGYVSPHCTTFSFSLGIRVLCSSGDFDAPESLVENNDDNDFFNGI